MARAVRIAGAVCILNIGLLVGCQSAPPAEVRRDVPVVMSLGPLRLGMSRGDVVRGVASHEPAGVLGHSAVWPGAEVTLDDGSTMLIANGSDDRVIQLSTTDMRIAIGDGIRCGMRYSDAIRGIGKPPNRRGSKWGVEFEVEPGYWMGFSSDDPSRDDAPIGWIVLGAI